MQLVDKEMCRHCLASFGVERGVCYRVCVCGGGGGDPHEHSLLQQWIVVKALHGKTLCSFPPVAIYSSGLWSKPCMGRRVVFPLCSYIQQCIVVKTLHGKTLCSFPSL